MPNNQSKKNNAGRPSKYKTHVLPRLKDVKQWSSEGLWDWQIAENLGISNDTFIEYKKQFSEFSEALREGQDVADQQVINAMFKRAIGYDFTEKSETYKGEVLIEKKSTKKHIPPDVSAGTFWLKKRRAAEWGDKDDAGSTGDASALVKAIEESMQ